MDQDFNGGSRMLLMLINKTSRSIKVGRPGYGRSKIRKPGPAELHRVVMIRKRLLHYIIPIFPVRNQRGYII